MPSPPNMTNKYCPTTENPQKAPIQAGRLNQCRNADYGQGVNHISNMAADISPKHPHYQ